MSGRSTTHPKRGLGRGLDALLGDSQVPTSPAGQALRELPVSAITPNPFQPRKRFDNVSLDDLKASIAEYGVLVPIIVRKRGEGYELVAGERRWRACAMLQRATIPSIVRESSDRDTLEVALIENLQRENLNPLEEAAGFSHLIEEYDFTQDELARRLGKSRPAIANALRLLTLSDAIKTMLVDGRLTAGHARAVLAAPAGARLALAQRASQGALSVRAIERLAAAAASGPKRKPVSKVAGLSANEHDFESRLQRKFGTRVALRRRGAGGTIEFRFAGDDDLVRIADLLLESD